MFEWNDEEIVDIIWGEPGETDDHIVPHPKDREETTSFPLDDVGKKQCIQEASILNNPGENLGPQNDIAGVKHETSQFEANEVISAAGLDLDSWTDLPASPVGGERGSSRTDMSGFTDVTSYNLVKGEPELFGNENEDKEADSFLDYSWANIGNFDDLDKIFRNDDSTLGHEMIGNVDELWSSSAVDVTDSGPKQPFSAVASSPRSEFHADRDSKELYKGNMDFVRCTAESLETDFSKSTLDSTCLKNVPPSKNEATEVFNLVPGAIPSQEEKTEGSTETTAETSAPQTQRSHDSGTVPNHVAEKVSRQRKLLKSRKKPEEMDEPKFTAYPTNSWPSPGGQLQQYADTRVPLSNVQSFPSSVLGGPESYRYLQTSNPYMHTGYGYPVHQFPVMPQMPQVHASGDPYRYALENYKPSPDSPKYGNQQYKLGDVHPRPPAMTPKEKIEKLRRRQQMQAMLAIQRQQQKLSNQISADQKRLQGSQGQDVTSSSVEVEENAGLHSSVEQDYSSKSSIDVFALAESIFNQLKAAIEKLDSRTRLRIRDSLFRLAKSAMQRHSISDTSSSNKNGKDEGEVASNEDTGSLGRSTRVPSTETDTNPIDRTVAHLLFHRPPEPSADISVKDEFLDSPISNPLPMNQEKLPLKSKTENADREIGCMSQRQNITSPLSADCQQADQDRAIA